METAIVLQLLIVLMLGLLEYGLLLWRAQQISNAARHGARIAVLPDATNTDVQTAVAALMTSAGFTAGQYTLAISPADVSTVDAGQTIQVSITVAGTDAAYIQVPLVPVPANIRGRVTMAKEGP